MRRVAEQLKVPPLTADVLVSGNATHGLNAMLPLIFELMAKRPLRIKCADVPATEMLGDSILCAAADQYTRLGREAIRRWHRVVPELADFLLGCGLTKNADAIIGMALFHIESSVLNSQLTIDCLELLREETERAEMAALGMNEDAVTELYVMMRRNLPVLNNLRRQLWKAR
jgi:hypothetical protein